MKTLRGRASTLALAGALLLAGGAVGCSSNSACEEFPDAEACQGQGANGVGGATGASGAVGADGGNGAGAGNGGTAGSGGDDVCGGCTAPKMCDEESMQCVDCFEHTDCSDADKSKCDAGTCVECDGPGQCAQNAAGEVCDDGTCVECTLEDDTACGANETCNLIDKDCSGPMAGTVGQCESCSNDDQCTEGNCVPLNFLGPLHGYYCLKETANSCTAQHFAVSVTKTSINGEDPTSYCGIDEDYATCEAVYALVNNRFCTQDGMCSETQGGTEFAVPGALCKAVDAFPGTRCTYGCAGVQQCPLAVDSCGMGGETPPGWCGG